MTHEPWYGVKCLFHHKDLKRRNGKHNYEERIVLIKANGFEEAIKKAELEAIEYCNDLGQEVEYLNFCTAFNIGEEKINDKTEIYSLITSSELSSADFISKYHDTGNEMTQKMT